jgi:hypothetical protein
MLTKEDFMPARRTGSCSSSPLRLRLLRPRRLRVHSLRRHPQIAGREIQLQAVTLNVGILYVLAMLS